MQLFCKGDANLMLDLSCVSQIVHRDDKLLILAVNESSLPDGDNHWLWNEKDVTVYLSEDSQIETKFIGHTHTLGEKGSSAILKFEIKYGTPV